MQPSNDVVEMDGQLFQFMPVKMRGVKGYTLEPYSLHSERRAKRTDKDRARTKATKAARKKNRR